MKNHKPTIVRSLVIAVTLSAATSIALADDGRRDVGNTTVVNKNVQVHRDVTYTHDARGWYDQDHHRHDFVVYQGRRGYWNYVNGAPVFVSIDAPGIHINL